MSSCDGGVFRSPLCICLKKGVSYSLSAQPSSLNIYFTCEVYPRIVVALVILVSSIKNAMKNARFNSVSPNIRLWNGRYTPSRIDLMNRSYALWLVLYVFLDDGWRAASYKSITTSANCGTLRLLPKLSTALRVSDHTPTTGVEPFPLYL